MAILGSVSVNTELLIKYIQLDGSGSVCDIAETKADMVESFYCKLNVFGFPLIVKTSTINLSQVLAISLTYGTSKSHHVLI